MMLMALLAVMSMRSRDCSLKSLDSRFRGNDEQKRNDVTGEDALSYRHSREGGNPVTLARPPPAKLLIKTTTQSAAA